MNQPLIQQSQTAIQSFHSASTQKVVKGINNRIFAHLQIVVRATRNEIKEALGLTDRQCSCGCSHLITKGKIRPCGVQWNYSTNHNVEVLEVNPNPEIIFKKVSDKQKIKEAKNNLDDFQDFDQFTKNQRDAFVIYINGLEWNTGLRTKCEDLLIAYDQMKERIKIVNEIINK